MYSKKFLALLLVAVIALLMGSCGEGKRTAATAAVQAAETAWETAGQQVMRFLPDSAKAMQGLIDSAKATLDRKDFKATLALATPLPGRITKLSEAANAKKEELTKSWQEMTPGIPPMLQAIRKQLTLLSIAKRLPPNVTKSTITATQATYGEISSLWEQAQTEFNAGNIPDATVKAQTVQEKAMAIMKALGIKAPAPPAPPKA